MKFLYLPLTSLLALAFFSVATIAAEEQVFIDDLTAPQLRNQIEIIQKEIYRVFNATNDDNQLEIVCHDYLATGTSIKREVCEPQFVITRRTANAKSARHGTDPLLTPLQLPGILSGEFQALREAITALTEESEYFGELNTIAGVLTTRLEDISK